ncbi:MAG: diguanylate cyclase [Lachnospirales bacterium]
MSLFQIYNSISISINMNTYQNLFFFCMIVLICCTIFIVLKQVSNEIPILTFFSVIVCFASILYNFMLVSTDIDTAIMALYLYHMIIPFLFPTLLLHINYTYLNKSVTSSSLSYYLFPLVFFLTSILFIDTNLFFTSKIVSKSNGITMIDIQVSFMYYLVYFCIVLVSILMIRSLIQARRRLNINKGVFILYISNILLGVILHIAYFEFSFIKIDMFLLIYQFLAILLCVSHINNNFILNSDTVLSSFLDSVQDPILILDETYNVEFANNSGKTFAQNYFSLRDLTYNGLSKCNWSDFCVNEYNRNIQFIDDFGIRSLRFELKDVTDFSNTVNERILMFYDNTTAATYENKISIASKKDALTGSASRSDIHNIIDKLYKNCLRNDDDLAVLAISITNLKEVNFEYGELAGDYVLKKTSYIIAHNSRQTDFIGRYGGNSFLIALNNTSYNRATSIAKNIENNIISSQYVFFKRHIEVSVSCGIVNYRALSTPVSNYKDFIDIAFDDLIKNREIKKLSKENSDE